MRKKYFYCRIPMNLQIFAEGGAGDGAGADGGNGGGAGAADQGEAELPSFEKEIRQNLTAACRKRLIRQ